MGYGLGACIGAQVGQPDKLCINIAGDGCFRMNMNELATASRYNIPIIQVVINNHVLGMVRQWQTLFYGKRYSQTVLNDRVDFCKVAEGLGCEAIRVTTREEVGPAIEKAIALKKPVAPFAGSASCPCVHRAQLSQVPHPNVADAPFGGRCV